MEVEFKGIGGRDLAAEFKCTYPSKLFKGTDIEHIMKETIRLSGYEDSHFFDVVNKEPRELTCRCGKEYTQQWFREGFVEVKELR